MNPCDEYIQRKLSALAADARVKILLAVESGSRAWGFPSADSDFDVRFIYMRPSEDYLSVFEARDVIETPLVHDAFLKAPIDLNGWDLRKAMRLGMKSNAVLIEWLASPVRYMADVALLPQFHAFIHANSQLPSLLYHYDRLARHAWQDIQASDGTVKLKRYFYALRPALACVWLRRHHRPPPMNLQELVAGQALPGDFVASLMQLIEVKKTANESDTVQRDLTFDNFICAALAERVDRPEPRGPTLQSIIQADKSFRGWLEASGGNTKLPVH